MQVGIEMIRKRLEHVCFTRDESVFIRLPWCNDPETQLSLLRALWFDPDKRMSDQVFLLLIDWPFNQDTVQALKDLPEWPCALHMMTSTWSDTVPDVGSALAQCVPTSYRVWSLPENTPVAVRNAVCAGLNARRKAEGCEGRVYILGDRNTQEKDVGEYVTLYGSSSAD